MWICSSFRRALLERIDLGIQGRVSEDTGPAARLHVTRALGSCKGHYRSGGRTADGVNLGHHLAEMPPLLSRPIGEASLTLQVPQSLGPVF